MNTNLHTSISHTVASSVSSTIVYRLAICTDMDRRGYLPLNEMYQ
ncbi:hypothetical protein [Enterococcus hailinensis]